MKIRCLLESFAKEELFSARFIEQVELSWRGQDKDKKSHIHSCSNTEYDGNGGLTLNFPSIPAQNCSLSDMVM